MKRSWVVRRQSRALNICRVLASKARRRKSYDEQKGSRVYFVSCDRSNACPVRARHAGRGMEQSARRDAPVPRFLARTSQGLDGITQQSNLVSSKKYLDKHDDLEKFLKRHPAVKREILDHPRRAFDRSYRDDHPSWARR